MTKLHTHIVFILLAFLTSVSIIFAQDSYKLEYKFQKGAIHRYSHFTNSNITQEMMGKEMKMTNTSEMIMRTVVDGITKDGNSVLIVSLDSAKNIIKSAMMDSTMLLDNLIGKRTRLTLTKLGKVIARDVIDTIKNEGPMGGSGQRGMSSIMKFPDKTVKFGEKWNSTDVDTIETMGGKIAHTSNMEYTLTGKDTKQGHDCLKIDYTGTTADTGKMMMGGMELFVEGSGKVKGSIYFDLKLGLTVYDESAIENEQTMAITGQQNMTIPMSVTSKSIKTLLEK